MNNKEFNEIIKKADDRTLFDKVTDCFIRPVSVGCCFIITMEIMTKHEISSWLLLLLGTLLGMMIYSLIQLCYYSNDRVHVKLTFEKDLALLDVIRDMDRRIKELEETKED